MFYFLLVFSSLFVYKYKKKIAIRLFSYYASILHFLETNQFINNNLKVINNSIKYYDINQNKYIDKNNINSKNGFINIYHNGKTKYISFYNLDYLNNVNFENLEYNTPKLFSSVILSFDNNNIECEDILNKFILPEIILNLDKTMAKIILKIKKINIKNVENFDINWTIITNKAKIYNDNKLFLTIEKNYNLRK